MNTICHDRPFWIPVAALLMITALAGTMESGCRHEPICVEEGEIAGCLHGSELLWMSPVRIVPLCGEGADDHILMSFCGELATALQTRRVPDVRIVRDCDVPCPGEPFSLAVLPDSPPEGPSGVVMYVAVPDFRPYRPMRMAVDVRVVQAGDEREVARVVDVFEGPQETPLRESPRQFRLFREIEREARADREAPAAFLSNSPRRFLTACANRVVDRLRFAGPLSFPDGPPPFPVGDELLFDDPAESPERTAPDEWESIRNSPVHPGMTDGSGMREAEDAMRRLPAPSALEGL